MTVRKSAKYNAEWGSDVGSKPPVTPKTDAYVGTQSK